MPETENIEFKKSLAELNEGLVSMAAMLNKHGHGELWFGIKNEGTPVGMDVSDATLRKVSQAIAAHIEPKPYPEVTSETLQEKHCIRIAFSGHDGPYFAHGRAYMRVSDEDRKLSARELENIILQKNRSYKGWDAEPSTAKLSEIDPARVSRFLKRAGLPDTQPREAELLRRVKLVEAWGRGIPLILERAPQVQFEEKAGLFITTLPRPPGTQTSVKKGGGEKLSPNRLRIVEAMRADSSISQARLAGIVGIGINKIENHIRYLKENKWIKRVGPAKGGHWEVLK